MDPLRPCARLLQVGSSVPMALVWLAVEGEKHSADRRLDRPDLR